MIKFLVMDVDGTLTDGKVYMGIDGEAFKAFDIKDGCGIKVLLPQHGIIPVIITARLSVMLENRCKELGITEVHQGVRNKLECLEGIIQRYSTSNTLYTLANCAYIGDDILDLQCLIPIKEAGGLTGCPVDAAQTVKQTCDYVSTFNAGKGAVRDYVEYVIAHNESCILTSCLKDRIDSAVDFISKLHFSSLKIGKYEVSSDFFYTVQEYSSFDENEMQYESHRKYIDIQWVYEGVEKLLVTDVNSLSPSDTYDEEKDVVHYFNTNNLTAVCLTPGASVILFPKDAHKPVRYMGRKCVVKKVVGKLKI